MVHGSPKGNKFTAVGFPQNLPPPEKNSKESHTKIEGGAAEARYFVQMITKGEKKNNNNNWGFVHVCIEYFGKP